MVQPAPPEAHGQKLTDNQRAMWAFQAGFTDAALVTAVAISIAENDTGAIDRVSPPNFDGSRDYGMWQINDRAHANLFAQFPQWWSQYNAQMAKRVYDEAGHSFNPWTTYKSKAYLLYTDRAKKAAQGSLAPVAGGPDSTVTVNTIPDALAAIANVANGTTNALKAIAVGVVKTGAWIAKPDNWARVGQVVIGGGLLVAAITVVLKPITKPVADAVLTVAGPAAGKSKTTAGKTTASTPQTSTKGDH